MYLIDTSRGLHKLTKYTDHKELSNMATSRSPHKRGKTQRVHEKHSASGAKVGRVQTKSDNISPFGQIPKSSRLVSQAKPYQEPHEFIEVKCLICTDEVFLTVTLITLQILREQPIWQCPQVDTIR